MNPRKLNQGVPLDGTTVNLCLLRSEKRIPASDTLPGNHSIASPLKTKSGCHSPTTLFERGIGSPLPTELSVSTGNDTNVSRRPDHGYLAQCPASLHSSLRRFYLLIHYILFGPTSADLSWHTVFIHDPNPRGFPELISLFYQFVALRPLVLVTNPGGGNSTGFLRPDHIICLRVSPLIGAVSTYALWVGCQPGMPSPNADSLISLLASTFLRMDSPSKRGGSPAILITRGTHG